MKALKVTIGVTTLFALGAIAITAPSTPARADAQSCSVMVPTINVNLGTVTSPTQPISTRVQALTLAVNAIADCLGFQHPVPGCSNSASFVLPSAIADLGFLSGMGTGFARLGLSFPAPSVSSDVGFIYSQLAFFVNGIGSCTN